MRKLLYIFAIVAAVCYGCGNGNKFKISGKIEGAKEEKLVVQRSDNGVWVSLDTITTNSSGEFSYRGDAPAFPEIYRIERGGQYAYFPIDSLDEVELKADTANFETGYTLTGSTNAEWLTEVNRVVNGLSGMKTTDEAYIKAKHELAVRLLKDPSSIVAYYTVEKLVDGHRLFAPENASDLKIIGAVATGYGTYRPGNPLARYMETEYMAGVRMQPRKTNPTDTLQAEQIGYFDIELKNENGQLRKLSDVAVSGKVVVLNFTTYAAEKSPEFNRILANIHTKYAARGLEIYQVGYDDNEFAWKDAAKNLPWTTVYDPAGLSSQNLIKYNLGVLPAVFIIGRDGSIAERVLDFNKLDSSVARHL